MKNEDTCARCREVFEPEYFIESKYHTPLCDDCTLLIDEKICHTTDRLVTILDISNEKYDIQIRNIINDCVKSCLINL